jgi:hypothetical protein
MPKLTSCLPKYRKHRASGQAIVTLSGVDFYLGPHGTKASNLEYDRLIVEWLNNGRRLLKSGDTGQPILVVELILGYMKWAGKHYRKNGKVTESYEALKSAFRDLRNLYGRTPVVEFGPKRLKALRLKMMEPRVVDKKTNKVKRLSRSTINAHCGAIRRLFRWAAAEELEVPFTYISLQATSAPEMEKVELSQSSEALEFL